MSKAKNAATNAARKTLTLAELKVGSRNVTRYYVYVGDQRYDTSTEALKSTGMDKAEAQKTAGKVLSLLKKGPVEIDGVEWRAEARV